MIGFKIESIQTWFDIMATPYKIFMVQICAIGSVIFVKITVVIKKPF
jgi:hypothetical protein